MIRHRTKAKSHCCHNRNLEKLNFIPKKWLHNYYNAKQHMETAKKALSNNQPMITHKALTFTFFCFQIFYFSFLISSYFFSFLSYIMYMLAYLLYTYNYNRCLPPLLLLPLLTLLLCLLPPVQSSSSSSSSSSSPPIIRPDLTPLLGAGRFLLMLAVYAE